MKSLFLAAAIATTFAVGGLATSSAEAGVYKKPSVHSHYGKVGKVTLRERVAIRRSSANLARIQARARADGKITPRERAQIRQAQLRHNAVVRSARR